MRKRDRGVIKAMVPTATAVLRIQSRLPHIPVIGLWVGDNWEVTELDDNSANNSIESTSDGAPHG